MRNLCLAWVLVLATAVMTGCSGGGDAVAYEHVYTVRARVTQLPDGSPGGGFFARHESIPDYVAANGSLGMNSMVMPFTIVDASVLDGVAEGDVVSITFGVSYEPEVKQGVISIEKLPSDTVLSFESEGT